MSVDIVPRKYNETERAFITKYGDSSFLIWETLPDSQKTDYWELERLYTDFFDLYKNHDEDLRLYALMYRNVPLYNITNDLLSMYFFVSKKDEIVSYKKILLKDKSSKGQIVKLYYENEALFPKVCIKYANINFQINRKYHNDWNAIFEALKKVRTGDIPHILSVNDLTEEQCEAILNHKNDLAKDYSELYDKYLGDISIGVDIFKGYDSRQDFCLKKLIPTFLNENSDKESLRAIILEYISQNYGNFIEACVRDEIKIIKSYNDRYNSLSKERQSYVNERDSLKKTNRITSRNRTYSQY